MILYISENFTVFSLTGIKSQNNKI